MDGGDGIDRPPKASVFPPLLRHGAEAASENGLRDGRAHTESPGWGALCQERMGRLATDPPPTVGTSRNLWGGIFLNWEFQSSESSL